MTEKLPFAPADILLPKTEHEKWACIACDQYTSQPEYWERARAAASGAPSALNIILPEVYLGGDDAAGIAEINKTMRTYLDGNIFEEYKNALIYVERTLPDGRIRHGLVGAFSLADYSFETGADCLIRPTEGTVLSRLPARVAIRKNAPIELPHIMIFMDDKRREIIERINAEKLRKLYDFELMLGGGHLRGYLVGGEEQRRVLDGLSALADECRKNGGLLFAMGDGNHSFAAAKAAAPLIGTPQAQYALAELVNIYDSGVTVEPIYRVLFNVDAHGLIAAFKSEFAAGGEKRVEYISAGESGEAFVDGLEAEAVQRFIDEYTAAHTETRVDYIHGEDALRRLAARNGAVGFLYGGVARDELFPYVQAHGIMPKKSFSVGQADEKRYYMEARRIQ